MSILKTIQMAAKAQKYITKVVRFNGNTIELYSLDGDTWSSRKDELLQIADRHESNRVTFGEIKSGVIKRGASPSDAEKAETPGKRKIETQEPPSKKTVAPPKSTAEKRGKSQKKKATKEKALKPTEKKSASPKKRSSVKAKPKKKNSSQKKGSAAA